MKPEVTQERLRELARRLSDQLPPGLSYALVVWPLGEPADCAYFSNAHKVEAFVALESLLAASPATGAPGRLTQAERELLEAAGCGWVLERLDKL